MNLLSLFCIGATFLLAALLSGAPAPGSQALSRISLERDVRVEMRDGVRLTTDLYFPDGGQTDGDRAAGGRDGAWPVILIRTPYNKSAPNAVRPAEFFASHGYVAVVQDTRGRWASEGVWRMLIDDGPDGYDTVEWVAAQPWSTGKIGMYGISYGGGTQHAAAMAGAPHLTTVIPIDAMANLGYQSMRNAGAFELRFWNWTYRMAAEGNRHLRDPGTAAALAEARDNRGYYLQNLPLRRGATPLRLAPEYEEWLVEGMRHGANGPFWETNNIIDFPERYKDIPVYLIGGWYDSWVGNTTATYIALKDRIEGPIHLLMGPWIHFRQGDYRHGQVSFGPDAALPDPLDWQRMWYDLWLKEVEAPENEALTNPVRIFVMGTGDGSKDDEGFLNHGGYWRNESEWPLERADNVPFYLHDGGGLSTAEPTAGSASVTWLFDPKHPVPTIGGQTSSQDGIMHQGAWNQRGGEHLRLDHFEGATEPIPLSARNDVLVFQTDPLEQDLEVTGEITVHLWVSSSAPDTDFTAKLIDVYPPNEYFPEGFDLLIGDGIVRARFRDSLETETLMEPGQVYPVTIRLYPTSNVFKKGHRIRVDLSSSNFPRFDVNPNTGEPLNDHRRVQKALNTVHLDAGHPSHILLPVIPSSGYNNSAVEHERN